MNSREKIGINDSMSTILVKMAEGNPGALTALMKLVEQDHDMAFIRMLDLDDMGMRGSQIWVAYKDHCKQDIATFSKAINERDPAMVDAVNSSHGHAPGTPPAVIAGASFA